MTEAEKIVALATALLEKGVHPKLNGTPAEQFVAYALCGDYHRAFRTYREASEALVSLHTNSHKG